GVGIDTIDLTSNDIDNDVVTDNPTQVYQGETLAIDSVGSSAESSGDTVDIDITNADTGTSLLDGSTGDGRTLLQETDDLSIGATYNVTFAGNSETVHQFVLSDLQLEATANDTDFDTGQGVDIDVSAVRGGEDVTVELNDTSEDDTIAKKSANLGGDAETTVTFGSSNFNEDNTGEFRVDVIDNQTGIEVSTDTITVSEEDEAQASFAESVSGIRGNEIRIPINLTETDQAELRIGEDGDGYNMTFGVTDDDGDGTALVNLSTYVADGNNAEGSAFSDLNPGPDTEIDESVDSGPRGDTDSVAGHRSGNLGAIDEQDIISPGTYTLQVAGGDPANVDVDQGGFDDQAQLTINSRGDSSLQLWTAPAGTDMGDLEDGADVLDAISNGTITQDSLITNGSYAVAQLQVDGLESAHNEADDSLNTNGLFGPNTNDGGIANQTERFFAFQNPGDSDSVANAAANSGLYAFQLNQTGAGQNQAGININPALDGTHNAASGGERVTKVVIDHDNNSYYVFMNTNRLNPSNAGAIQDGDVMEVEFKLHEFGVNESSYGLVAPDSEGDFQNESVTSEFELDEPDAEINGLNENDELLLQPGPNVTISGTSNVAPTANLTIRVVTDSDQPSSFIESPEVEVTEEGTWAVTYPDVFADAIVGTEFDIEVKRAGEGGETIASADGIVVGEPTVNTLTFDDQDSTGTTVLVNSVNLSAGGFVAIHQGSPTGDIIGVTDYIGRSVQRTNVAIGLDTQLAEGDYQLYAMPHKDSDGDRQFDFPDGDGPYTDDNGTAITDVAAVTVGAGATPTATPTPTPTETPTATPTETATATATATATPTETEAGGGETTTTTTGGGGPGFGLTAAVIALLAAAFLALRRRD
ncbi:MAG: BGTF surface domain-containing protein, partial [Halobacteriales archaeon]